MQQRGARALAERDCWRGRKADTDAHISYLLRNIRRLCPSAQRPCNISCYFGCTPDRLCVLSIVPCFTIITDKQARTVLMLDQRKETKIPLEEAKPLPGHSSNLYLLLSCHLPLCTFCEKGRCGNLPPFDSICLSYGRAQETSQQPKCKYWRAGNVSETETHLEGRQLPERNQIGRHSHMR